MAIAAESGQDETSTSAASTAVADVAESGQAETVARAAQREGKPVTHNGSVAEYELLSDGKKERRASRRIAALGEGRPQQSGMQGHREGISEEIRGWRKYQK